MNSPRDPVLGAFVLPDARRSSKQKAPRGKETRPSKFVLRKRRNKVPKHSQRNAREKDFSTSNCFARSGNLNAPKCATGKSSLRISRSAVGAWVTSQRSNREWRTIWIVDANRGDGKRCVVRADEKLTAFVQLESAAGKEWQGS
jgi:hypothetical protein